MAAGELDRRVTIQQRTLTPQGDGTLLPGFADVAETWASIRTLEGLEVIDGVQREERPTHRFRMRARSDVDGDHWLEYAGRKFRILSVEDVAERGRFLEVVTSEDRGG